MTRPVAFVDMDNCISDDRWRRSLIDRHLKDCAEKYARYHLFAGLDSARNLYIFDQLWDHDIAIVSSRPTWMFDKTVRWLQHHELRVQWLILRSDESMPSPLFKLHSLAHFPFVEKVDTAIDDREDVLEAYAAAGIPNCRRLSIDPRIDEEYK